MPDYKNGKIYKIVSNVTNDVYIGSTCSPLSQRLAEHRRKYNQYLNGKFHYITSFKVLETNDYSIILMEDYPCEKKEQLLARERLYIQGCDTHVNKNLPTRTNKEYRQDNQDYFKEYNRNRPNKQERLDKHKQYYEQKKDEILEQQKEYYQNHKQDISKQRQDYYERNKEKISENKKTKYVCCCGSEIVKRQKVRHEKSLKHQSYIQQQEQI